MPAPSRFQEHADTIRINEMEIILPLCSGAQWAPTDESSAPVLQPIAISLSIRYDTRKTAMSDDIASSIDYSILTDRLQKKLIEASGYSTIDDVAQVVCRFMVKEYSNAFDGFELDVVQRKGSLICDALAVSYTSLLVLGQWKISKIRHVINGLACSTILGINPKERQIRQEVRTTIEILGDNIAYLDSIRSGNTITRQIYEAIYHSQYLTLEALASYVAKLTLTVVHDGAAPVQVKVCAAKPHAIPLAASAEVIIHRTYADFAEPRIPPTLSDLAPYPTAANVGRTHTAVLALGSNLGDRFRNIEYALRLLEIPGEVLQGGQHGLADTATMTLRVDTTSFLYETTPMYVTDQPAFINGACVIETNLSPLTLLRLVKTIETLVGRVPSIRNGPRAVDIDIIFFDTLMYDTRPVSRKQDLDDCEGHLIIPHPRLAEREFVLRPLNDIIPDYISPGSGHSVRELFQWLGSQSGESSMHMALPFPRLPLEPSDNSPYPSIPPIPRTLTYWTYTTSSPMRFKTHLMATLNTTPDSFSDGAAHNSLPPALEYVREAVSAGSSIVDVGGYSTRPGADFVSVEEEIKRVVPFVKAIRQYDMQDSGDALVERVKDILISVDTFRPEVAEAAVAAGANCINDVYAFTGKDSYDHSEEGRVKSQATMEDMKRIARKFATPVILMHSRGDAGQNKDYSMYSYASQKEPVLEGIRVELGEKVNSIVTGKGAVRRWLVMIDPGIGFSKTVEGNLQTLRNAAQITADMKIGDGKLLRNPLAGFPQLIGTSRKSFLGTILSQKQSGRETTPKERIWATAAAVACSVQQGALVARVHDVKEIHDVIAISDALWRT